MSVRFRTSVKSNFDLGKAAQSFKNMTPLMKSIGDVRRKQFDSMVKKGLSPEGKPLRDLSSGYLARKRKKYGSKPKRVASGNTVGKYTQRTYRNALIETIDSPIANYLAKMDLPLLPESYDSLPTSQRNEIKRAIGEYIQANL